MSSLALHPSRVERISDCDFICEAGAAYGGVGRKFFFSRCTFAPAHNPDSLSMIFGESYFEDCTFRNFQSEDSNFYFKNSTFNRCIFNNIHFYGANFEGATIQNSTLTNVSFKAGLSYHFPASLEHLKIQDSRLQCVDFKQKFVKIFTEKLTADAFTLRSLFLNHHGLPGLILLESLDSRQLDRNFKSLEGALIKKLTSESGHATPFYRINFSGVSFTKDTVLINLFFDECRWVKTDFHETRWDNIRLRNTFCQKIRYPKNNPIRLLPPLSPLPEKKLIKISPIFFKAAELYHSEGISAFMLLLLNHYIVGSRWDRIKQGAWNRHYLEQAEHLRDQVTAAPRAERLEEREARIFRLIQEQPPIRRDQASQYAGIMHFAENFLGGYRPEDGVYP
jgi:uncharacterized protein YjbI with pentapeptide repeats